MQARVRVALVLGGAALAGAAIILGFRSQSGPELGTHPVGTPAIGDVSTVIAGAAAESHVAPSSAPPATSAAGPIATPVLPESTPASTGTLLTSTDARALLRSARLHLDAGQPSDAAPLVQRALELRPLDAGAWNVLGRTELGLHHVQEAETAFRRACDLDSTNAYARNNLGWLYLQQGRWTDALPWLEAAVHLHGDLAYFHNNLGVAYERLGRWNDASVAYARAVELEPERVNARLSLARVSAHLEPGLAAAAVVSVDSTVAGRANLVNP